MTEQDDTRQILFEMGKDAILINCRLFPENAGELAQNLLKMHKELYPEKHSKPADNPSESSPIEPSLPKRTTIRFPPGFDPTTNYPSADKITEQLDKLLKKKEES